MCSFESLGESEGQLQPDGGIHCLSPTLRDEPPGENGECLEVGRGKWIPKGLVPCRGSEQLIERVSLVQIAFLPSLGGFKRAAPSSLFNPMGVINAVLSYGWL